MLEIDDDAIERMIVLSSNKNPTDQMIKDTIESMNIKTTLTLDEMMAVFKSYYQNLSDSAVAVSLGDRKKMRNVERARIKLGLFKWRDFEMPFDINEFLPAIDAGKTDAEIAAMFSAGKSTVRTYRQLIDYHEAYGAPDVVVDRK
ncbi:MAG: hypothetical protein EF813_07775 [Methanosarcinales archaeon]|nr:MAG: hypothetical protein EF813_07775 [Methanosarcinales archaeon]